VIHVDDNGFNFYVSLDEIKQDNLTPIPVTEVLSFFQLRGKTSKLSKENLIPLECQYVVLAKEKDTTRYYTKTYRGYSVDEIYFSRRSLEFSGDDVSLDSLRRYIYDNKVWLLMTPEMVEDTKKMLDRVRRANVTEGLLTYRLYLQILEAELKLAEYRINHSSQVGFKTCCKIQEDYIRQLWQKVSLKK